MELASLPRFLAELAITVADPVVWRAALVAIFVGAACLAFGVWCARTVGLLRAHAPLGEALGVGLSAGLMVSVSWWAAIASGGRSAFTPVAIGFAFALAIGIARRMRASHPDGMPSTAIDSARRRPWGSPSRPLVLVLVAAGCFVVTAGLFYGATIAPSIRDGYQPVEHNDVAFYAVLGRNLASTGVETTLSASGFSEIPGTPEQNWYHWGELWLAAAAIRVFDLPAMAARYFVALPLVLLAAAALSGAVVRRWTGAETSRPFLFGFLGCLLLAPVSLIPGPFFASWAAGMLFSITLYGLVAVAALFTLYCIAAIRGRESPWGLTIFVGSAVAFVLPAHVAVAILAVVGVGAVVAVRLAEWLAAGRPRPIQHVPGRVLASVFALTLVTAAWGVLTGHTFGGGSGQTIVSTFNDSWLGSVALTTLGAGIMLLPAVALPRSWRVDRPQANLYLATIALVAAGAIGWGARLGDFTMFYLFFAGIAVIATPVAVIAAYAMWSRLSRNGHTKLAFALVILCAVQLEAGLVNAFLRLHWFSAGSNTVSVQMIEAIRHLPPAAKLAYRCQVFGESGFGVPELVSIDAHAGRAVVPMCYLAETLSTFIGAPLSEEEPNVWSSSFPQFELYPHADSAPSDQAVLEFLQQHGIAFLYADPAHPALIADAIPVATSGDAQILRLP